MKGLSGKVAIVTGGGSGLGEAIGARLAREGAKVVLTDIKRDAAERVAREISKAGGTATAVQQDTARPEDNERVVAHAVSTYGALHYAVNNAGIGGRQAPVGDVDLEDWRRVIAINLDSRSSSPGTRSDGSARPTRSRPSSASCSPTRRRSSRAGTTSWMEAIRPSDPAPAARSSAR